MKQVIFLLLTIAVLVFLSMRPAENNKDLSVAVQSINALYARHAASLDSFLAAYPAYFYDSSAATREKKYRELAYYFKRAAGYMIALQPDLYYQQLASPFQFARTNRPGFFGILPDVWLFLGPIGNEPDSVLLGMNKKDSADQINFIKEAVGRYRVAISGINARIVSQKLSASDIFDVLRVEIFRISALDIANSDFVISAAGLPSLNGAVDSWLLYADELMKQAPPQAALLQKRWTQTTALTRSFLAANQNFAGFNRLYFIKNCLVPLSQLLNELQKTLQVPYKQKWSAVRSTAAHAYDKNIFNADFFAPGEEAYYSAEKAKLGELLFFDPILSDNNRRACASCHKPELAFTDGQEKATGFERDDLPRNSPTVINAGFQKKSFWDMRAGSLEDQLDSVVNNPNELHSSFERVADRINASPEYVALFQKAFPAVKKTGIGRQQVKAAIGVYERTVTGLNSRFDQYMQGDASKLSPQEINGFNVYMGKAKCGVCHFAPLFNGAMPPFYDITDHHSIGVPLRDTMDKYAIDPDTGLQKITGEPFTRFSFKTPTVRNVARTAPYMHNGVYKTLEQVVNFYDHGGGTKFMSDYGTAVKGLPFFTLFPEPLKLTPEEKKELVAFLGALTDTSAARKPSRLPDLKGKYASSNKRVIGGLY